MGFGFWGQPEGAAHRSRQGARRLRQYPPLHRPASRAAERYGGIGLLDADNWIDKDHISRCVEAASAMRPKRPDFVIARRRFMRPTKRCWTIMDEPVNFTSTRIASLPERLVPHLSHLGLIPKELSLLGDRSSILRFVPRAWFRRSSASQPSTIIAVGPHVQGIGEPAGGRQVRSGPPTDRRLAQYVECRDLEIVQRLTGVRFVRNEK